MSLATGFVPPCIPTRAVKPPAGRDWVHEIKHDGYRLQVRRVGDQVRLFTRRGYDWRAVPGDRHHGCQVACRILRARRRGGVRSGRVAISRGGTKINTFTWRTFSEVLPDPDFHVLHAPFDAVKE
jgi:ATP dependent DNA ligase domain